MATPFVVVVLLVAILKFNGRMKTERPISAYFSKLPIILPKFIARSPPDMNHFSKLIFTNFYICQHSVCKGISYFSLLSCC